MFLSLAVHKNQIIKEWVHQTNLLSKCGINIKTYIHIYIRYYIYYYICLYTWFKVCWNLGDSRTLWYNYFGNFMSKLQKRILKLEVGLAIKQKWVIRSAISRCTKDQSSIIQLLSLYMKMKSKCQSLLDSFI